MAQSTTQKTLYIIRHGKSSWDLSGVEDIDRPLNQRGIDSSYQMASLFFGRNTPPDLILSSPATRAVHTAIIFARVLRTSFEDFSVVSSIYGSDENELLQTIQWTDDSIKSLMVFGHNPTFTDFVNKFLHTRIENIPTAGMVTLEFKCNLWKDISPAHLVSSSFDFPKKLN